ncbi:MAG TPA: hypothetical protein VHX11_08945 [Acidobacteriaceae bacterium]|jgi:hypothetical protein|nr:hypothetical protein [Acidobacteriaceae bacterium]
MEQLAHVIIQKVGDGHQVKHMLHGFKQPASEHKFPMPKNRVVLPAGHVLTHLAQHLGIPHQVGEMPAAAAPMPEESETE